MIKWLRTIMDKGPTRLNDAVTMARTIFGNRRVFNHKLLESEFTVEDGSAGEDTIAVCVARDSQSMSPCGIGDGSGEQTDIISGGIALLGVMQDFSQGRRKSVCYRCGRSGYFRWKCSTKPSRSLSQSPKPVKSAKDKPSKNVDGGNARADVSPSQPLVGLINSRDAGVMCDLLTGVGHLDGVRAEGSHFPGVCVDQVTSVTVDGSAERRSL